jgi:hypothetical protein
MFLMRVLYITFITHNEYFSSELRFDGVKQTIYGYAYHFD